MKNINIGEKMRKRILILGIMTMTMWNIIAAAEKFDHSLFEAILQKHVSNGVVDYAALKSNHEPLIEYLNKLDRVNAEEFQNWSENEQKVFWINAYNALTLESHSAKLSHSIWRFACSGAFPEKQHSSDKKCLGSGVAQSDGEGTDTESD
jgi:50S ribosomal subunit-associated GTPase HflX